MDGWSSTWTEEIGWTRSRNPGRRQFFIPQARTAVPIKFQLWEKLLHQNKTDDSLIFIINLLYFLMKNSISIFNIEIH